MIDFIGVGAEKTGSSWLFRSLLEHPQICGPKGKETMFFDTTRLIDRPPREKSAYENSGIEGYQKFFAHCPPDSIKGEFTTTYLHDKKVAGIIARHFPNVKIIILLRNPVEKAFAQYIGLEGGRLFKSFEEALAKEPEFVRRSQYAEYVSEYLSHFPRENIFIGLYDDLEKDAGVFLKTVYSFLGVDSDFQSAGLNQKVDSEEHKMLTAFRNSLLSNSMTGALIKLSRILKLNFIFKELALFFIKKASIEPYTRERLRKIFAPDIERLEKLIGRDLSTWK